MKRPRRKEGVIQEDVPGTGECVLLDKERGRILALNPTGAALWDLLDGARAPADLAAVLAEAAGADSGQVEEDVRSMLERLADEGFLEEETE